MCTNVWLQTNKNYQNLFPVYEKFYIYVKYKKYKRRIEMQIRETILQTEAAILSTLYITLFLIILLSSVLNFHLFIKKCLPFEEIIGKTLQWPNWMSQ